MPSGVEGWGAWGDSVTFAVGLTLYVFGLVVMVGATSLQSKEAWPMYQWDSALRAGAYMALWGAYFMIIVSVRGG